MRKETIEALECLVVGIEHLLDGLTVEQALRIDYKASSIARACVNLKQALKSEVPNRALHFPASASDTGGKEWIDYIVRIWDSFAGHQQMTEQEIRNLRDIVYGVPCSDESWNSIKENWMRADSVRWLIERSKIKLSDFRSKGASK